MPFSKYLAWIHSNCIAEVYINEPYLRKIGTIPRTNDFLYTPSKTKESYICVYIIQIKIGIVRRSIRGEPNNNGETEKNIY